MSPFDIVIGCIPEIPWVLANLFAILLGAMNLERHRTVSTVVIGASVVALVVSLAAHTWWIVAASFDLWTTLGEVVMLGVSMVLRVIALVAWLAMVFAAILGREVPE
ncbi:MAG: hypothetical protein H6737_31990 [Alphaproteobacteria bacterium]|nr:hypothetical protein [Alphaproteobacteria bacterium]